MTKHNLLTPRFKVIADYPTMERNGNYKVGDILTDNGETAVTKQNGDSVFACEWEKYPHLFKKLEWWEERKKEEMPKHIQSKRDGKVAIVEKWNMSKDKSRPEDIYASVRGYCWFVTGNEPLTEEEFNSIISGEEKKEENKKENVA